MPDAAIPPPPKHLNSELSKYILERGGIFHLTGSHNEVIHDLFISINNLFTRSSVYAYEHLYTEKPRPISFGFISDTNLNAFAYASPDGEFDFIGLHVGAIFTLMDIFNRAMSIPDFFAEVGDPTRERQRRGYARYLTTDIIREGNSTKIATPRCPVRVFYSNLMLQTSLEFLFFHEVTHLRNGHVDWLRSKRKKISITDPPEAKSIPDRILLQSFEMDADAGAVLLTLNSAYDKLGRKISDDCPRELADALNFAYSNQKYIIRIVMSSIYFLFRIFDLKGWDVFNQHELSHPQAPLRQQWTAATAFELFSNRSEYNLDPIEYSKLFAGSVKEIELCIGSILNSAADFRGIMSITNSQLAINHLEKVKLAWTSVRDEL